MARKMADDAQETFRARIVYRQRKHNPDYRYGETPRYLDEYASDERSVCYGPYGTAAAARGQLSRERAHLIRWGADIIDSGVDRAHIDWTEV